MDIVKVEHEIGDEGDPLALPSEINIKSEEVSEENLFSVGKYERCIAEPWAVTTLKEEVKDEITTEELNMCLESINPEHGTTSSLIYVGESEELELDCTGRTDPHHISDTDGRYLNKLFPCAGNENNQKEYKLHNYTQSHTNDKIISSEVYKDSFSVHENGDGYTPINIVDKNFQCDLCNNSYRTYFELAGHMHIHTGEKNFTCKVCNKSFRHSSHFLQHTGEKAFKCEVCNKFFRCSRQIQCHMRFHKDQKPFTCEICYRSFTNVSAFARHMHIHNCEKNLSCELCKNGFRHSSHPKCYLRTHTGERPLE